MNDRTHPTARASVSPPPALRLGIDGGGTGCRARLVGEHGQVLGEGESGPANLALGAEPARAAVLQATRRALHGAGLPDSVLARTAAGLGLAAANVGKHRDAFARLALPFHSFVISSDAEAACLGAHAGRDGAILILGTGSQGVLHRGGRFSTVGGWGFALSDDGSGALLGREAVRQSFQVLDGVAAPSGLTRAVMDRFGSDRGAMLEWAAAARPGDWAVFARLVFEHAAQHDALALRLVLDSAVAAERLLDRLVAMGAQRIALMGGVAAPTRRYLSSRFDPVLVEPVGDAMDGALLLAAKGEPPLHAAG
jgi:glucosamine kinase